MADHNDSPGFERCSCRHGTRCSRNSAVDIHKFVAFGDNGGPWGVPDRRAVSGCGQCREPPLRAGPPSEGLLRRQRRFVSRWQYGHLYWKVSVFDMKVNRDRSLCKTKRLRSRDVSLIGVLEDSSAIIAPSIDNGIVIRSEEHTS